MTKLYLKWLRNAAIRMKFIPTQLVIILVILIMGFTSVFSVYTLNKSSQAIFNVNVAHSEMLHEIVTTMYRCRVLGRDILLTDNYEEQLIYYADYIIAFETLDSQMVEFSNTLEGEKKERFDAIIIEKNKYKESMILSADIQIQGGSYEEAVVALKSVTPIANAFFGSIDSFLVDETTLMEEALMQNDRAVITTLIIVIFVNLTGFILIFVLTQTFTKTMSSSLIKLEKTVSTISETGNMKTPIDEDLFTKDEIGQIAKVVDKMRSMLLAHSHNDTLTGGYNAKAYHEEIDDLFTQKLDGFPVQKFWCIVFDMNNLKIINDTNGHVEGDFAIKTTFSIINSQLKDNGKVFRIGGDEFVALIYNLTEAEINKKIALIEEKMLEANMNRVLKFSVAIGYAEFEGSSREDFEEHFKIVDKKMYLNKEKIKRMDSRPEYDQIEDDKKNKESLK